MCKVSAFDYKLSTTSLRQDSLFFFTHCSVFADVAFWRARFISCVSFSFRFLSLLSVMLSCFTRSQEQSYCYAMNHHHNTPSISHLIRELEVGQRYGYFSTGHHKDDEDQHKKAEQIVEPEIPAQLSPCKNSGKDRQTGQVAKPYFTT